MKERKQNLNQNALDEIKREIDFKAGNSFTITSQKPVKKEISLVGSEKKYVGWTVWAERKTSQERYLLVLRERDRTIKTFPSSFIPNKITTKNL